MSCLYYVSISPFIFKNLTRKKEIAIEVVLEKFKNLHNLFLIQDEKWGVLLNNFMSSLDNELKKDIEEYLIFLSKRNKIIKQKCDYNSEKILYKCFENFIDHFIASFSKPEKILLLSEFKNKNFNDSFIREKLTYEEVDKNLQKMLMFSEKVEFIDPYFIPGFKKDVINLIENHLASFLNKKGKIIFHVRYEKKFHGNNIKKWKEIQKNSNHSIKVMFWDDHGLPHRMHDRYIITESIIASIGKGLEIHSDNYWTTTYWNFFDYHEANKILKNYRKNSSDFELKYEI